MNFDSLFTEQEKNRNNHYQIKKLLENLCDQIKKTNPKFDLNEAITYSNTSLGSSDYSNNGLFNNISMQLTKRAWDHLLIKDLVGVQPMNSPMGIYYALRYYAQGIYNGHTNPELGLADIDPTFTKSASLSAAEALGSDTSSEEGLGIGTDEHIKEIFLKLEKKTVEAETRKLKASFSEEIFQDILMMHDVNLRDQLLDALAKEIASEINIEIVNKIDEIAIPNSLDFGTVAGDNRTDKYNSFVSYITNLSNQIAKNTNHGAGNYVLASTNISGTLESTATFSVSTIAENSSDVSNKGISFAGTISNRVKVYRNIFWDTDKYIIGFKGKTELDAGIFYMPYIFMFLQSNFEDSFQKSLGILSRYGIGENIFGAQNYYQKVEVSNFDDFY